MYIISVYTPPITIRPCTPNPCGPNAICQERDNSGSCSCVPGYFGNPYEGCRPECVLNSDCPDNRACVNNKCHDPCLGYCGLQAICQVVNHVPKCTCTNGYAGNAYERCTVIKKGPFQFYYL